MMMMIMIIIIIISIIISGFIYLRYPPTQCVRGRFLTAAYAASVRDHWFSGFTTCLSISLFLIPYVPWHRHQVEVTKSVSSEKHRQCGLNEIAQIS